MRIAIPSMPPGGVEALSSPHFGHCELYTLADIADGKIQKICVIDNMPHVQGGCMAPVNYLKSHDVEAVLVGGIGFRPLMGFKEVGIDVYAGAAGTIDFVVTQFLEGNLNIAGDQDVCGQSRQ